VGVLAVDPSLRRQEHRAARTERHRQPAQIGIGHLDAFPGTLHEAAAHVVYQDGHTGELVKRARDYDRRRKHGEPIVVQGVHPQPPAVERVSTWQRVEFRSASAVNVSRARRELDLVIAPAETPTVIYERSKRYTEVFTTAASPAPNATPAASGSTETRCASA
jgi:hypothetical protein